MLSGPRRLMSISCSHSSGLVSRKFWKRSQPALLTSTSIGCVSERASSPPRSSRYRRPEACLAVALRSLRLRPFCQRREPGAASAKRRQMALPMAPPPPVTSTVFPISPFTDGRPASGFRLRLGAGTRLLQARVMSVGGRSPAPANVFMSFIGPESSLIFSRAVPSHTKRHDTIRIRFRANYDRAASRTRSAGANGKAAGAQFLFGRPACAAHDGRTIA